MLMQPVRAPAVERAGFWPLACAWLLASVIMLIAGWGGITGLEFPDPDDALRLQQVRDWVGGQSWFDVTQYRLNVPDGAPMHWSRLVDVPIAAVIVLLRPLLGVAGAELAALIVVPLLTLAVVMALVARLTAQLLDRDHARLAAFLLPVSIMAVHQLRPLRIDHHGWQIVLALVSVLAAMDHRQRRSGLIAGAAVALWLQISLEGLPFAVTLAALFGLRWLLDTNERERLVSFVAALAGGSIALFLLTRQPSDWALVHCDAISVPHLGMFAIGAAGTLLVAMSRVRTVPAKLGAMAAVGVAALLPIVALAPECAAGPFQAIDPLVREFWYERVLEGLPIWRQSPTIVAAAIAFPLIGLYGSWRARQQAEGTIRDRWTILCFLLAGAAATTVFVQRAGSLANVLALPGGVFLFEQALVRARAIPRLPKRLLATLAALLIVTPAYAVMAVHLTYRKVVGDPILDATRDCVTRPVISKLDVLRTGNIAAPLDISPAIVVYTRHSAIASGHHRNAPAMRDVIDIFTGTPEEARRIMTQRHIDYVAICPALIEPAVYMVYAPDGFWSQLSAGRVPSWMTPVRLPEPTQLLVWRVQPER